MCIDASPPRPVPADDKDDDDAGATNGELDDDIDDEEEDEDNEDDARDTVYEGTTWYFGVVGAVAEDSTGADTAEAKEGVAKTLVCALRCIDAMPPLEIWLVGATP